jgi:hypothetical protein
MRKREVDEEKMCKKKVMSLFLWGRDFMPFFWFFYVA